MLALALMASYLLGSIPTGYLLVKWTKRMDIRTVGSGNIGATNALRTAGPSAGFVVLVLDFLKGAMATGLIPRWVLGSSVSGSALACGFAAVVGHDFSCFLRFRGGKGVATTLGALFAGAPWVAGMVIGVWLVVFLLFRYVSVGSLAAAVAIPISQLVAHQSFPQVLIGSLFAALIIVRHRGNLQRLLSGVEPRARPHTQQ